MRLDSSGVVTFAKQGPPSSASQESRKGASSWQVSVLPRREDGQLWQHRPLHGRASWKRFSTTLPLAYSYCFQNREAENSVLHWLRE